MNKQHVRLAIAPIGWTNDDMPELGSENTFQQTVSEMALRALPAAKWQQIPARSGHSETDAGYPRYRICNAWFSTFFAAGEREKTLDEFVNHMNFLHAMGAKVIGCSEQSGSIQCTTLPVMGPDKPCFSEEEWARVAEGYNTLGRLAAEKGCRSVCITTWAPAFRPRRR
ncbi:Inosose dehydratase [Cronobacter sakazakii]|nr:Inosose dehydratase [Cronobacter sakazakii]